ncbi:ergothioneine biosynthesis glutamate--cysteine ligase EgtA [Frankia sp. AgPm24]|uniref:ergothioneine biosynthesis glutamate--cysteine ligase EgtA n=1 Tax=Frankia sp. AgPm24 TaxID=631128 RepID=UPI00200F981D|nr:ergothioneine biosynthesis glutamate--cysteine ligase EgtA [Frankia sp. AgPm24]MCK9920551.1 ergothioneine biosynthesis glutamate--cysteine ligase EgtA [Frankia sp. AgPm24]
MPGHAPSRAAGNEDIAPHHHGPVDPTVPLGDEPLDRAGVVSFALACVTPPTASREERDETVGIETEWFVVDRRAVDRPVPPERTGRALAAIAHAPADTAQDTGDAGGKGSPGDAGGADLVGTVLPGGSRLTFEPGGQLELSGPPATLSAALAATAADLRLVRAALAQDGLALIGMGTDPLRAGICQTTASRYAAMGDHFRAGGGAAGEAMMFSTASVQVNLDLGADPVDAERRFQLAHTVGPVLTAMFAASPALAGRRTGWHCTRQSIWAGIDASRTGSVLDIPPDTDSGLAARWARYLLAAPLMMTAIPGRRDADGHRADHEEHFVASTAGHTLADWLDGHGPVDRPPTVDDLRYHATTLFPPVRPRGWWEIRYLDAQPGDGWQVAVAVTTALLTDPVASAGAAVACEPVTRHWSAAATVAMGDPALARAGADCLALAVDALRRAGSTEELLGAVERFAQRYTLRGRCPADDLSERLAQNGPAGLLREEAQSCVPAA